MARINAVGTGFEIDDIDTVVSWDLCPIELPPSGPASHPSAALPYVSYISLTRCQPL